MAQANPTWGEVWIANELRLKLVTLSAVLDELHNRVSAMPWLFERKPESRSYKFMVTGFTLNMFFAMMIPKPIRRICSARHGFVCMSQDRDSDLLKTGEHSEAQQISSRDRAG